MEAEYIPKMHFWITACMPLGIPLYWLCAIFRIKYKLRFCQERVRNTHLYGQILCLDCSLATFFKLILISGKDSTVHLMHKCSFNYIYNVKTKWFYKEIRTLIFLNNLNSWLWTFQDCGRSSDHEDSLWNSRILWYAVFFIYSMLHLMWGCYIFSFEVKCFSLK